MKPTIEAIKIKHELTTSELVNLAKAKGLDISRIKMKTRKTKKQLINKIISAGVL